MGMLDLLKELLRSPEDTATAAQLVDETLAELPPASARFDLAELRAHATLYGLPQAFYSGPRGRAATPVDDPLRTLERLFRPRQLDGTVLLEVPQCHAIALPTAQLDRLWLEAALSECSLLIARGPEVTLAAHIGFSYTLEAEAALALARALGADAPMVICPDDLTHAGTPYPGAQTRMQVADWRAAGCRTVVFDARHRAGRGWTGLARPVLAAGELFVLRGDSAQRAWTPTGLLAA